MNPKGPLLMHIFWACCWTCHLSREGSSVPQLCSLSLSSLPKASWNLSGEITASFSFLWVQTVLSAQLWPHITLPVRHKPCLLCLKCWTPTPLPLPLFALGGESPHSWTNSSSYRFSRWHFPLPVRTHTPTTNNETEALRTAATKEILFDYQTLGSFLKFQERKLNKGAKMSSSDTQ